MDKGENMGVRIMTDSGSDIPQNTEGITVIPLQVAFGEETFEDGVNLDHKTFYDRLTSGEELPTTSQATPYTFEQYFREAVEAGDEVVIMTLSSKLSGTYQSACIAAEEYEGKVFVVDSKNVTIGQQVLTEYALMLAKEGKSAAEIAAILETERDNVHLLALLDTLEYLKRGGRISAAAAFAGGLLSIKPVVCVKDGEVVVQGKARGSKQGNNLINKEVEAAGGIDFSKPYTVGYTGNDTTLLENYVKDNATLWQDEMTEVPVTSVGAAIGTHVGPGAIAVAFFGKN